VHVRRIETCAKCGGTPFDHDEGGYVVTCRATRLDPEEGEWVCDECLDKHRAAHDAAEEARLDRWRDRRLGID
jgi:hypothetical protein